MKYTVSLDPGNTPGSRVVSVEADTPTPRVLLRNSSGSLDAVLDEIKQAIKKHAANPWGEPCR